MPQEDKELLIKDLCTRLPYGVKCKDQYGDYINVNIYNAHIEHLIDQIVSGVIQMVLRPLSSMTEDERKEYNDIVKNTIDFYNCPKSEEICVFVILTDWLNKHHFDYRGLIKKGLALEAPEEMYDLKGK